MTMASAAVNFVRGFWFPFTSFSYVRRHPSLYPFIIIPFGINVTTFILVIYFGFDYFRGLVQSWLPQGEAWYWLILNYFLLIFAIVMVLVLIFFTFAVVGSLLASPFNDVLSEKTELLIGGQVSDEPFALGRLLRDVRLTLVTEVKKISLFLLGMMALLTVHLLPVLGSILYPFLSVAWTAFFLVIEYTGYVFARKQLGFSEQRQIIFRHIPLMAGFGLGLFCILAVPFLQFFCIPLGVVGAVRLLAEADELSVAGPLVK